MLQSTARKLTVQAIDTSGSPIEYSFDYDPTIALESDQQAAATLKTTMGAVNALTTNTYADTAVTDTFSLNALAAS